MPAPDEFRDSPPSSDRYDPNLDLQAESVINLLRIVDSGVNVPLDSDDSTGKEKSVFREPVTPDSQKQNQQFQEFDKNVWELFDAGRNKDAASSEYGEDDSSTKIKMDHRSVKSIPLGDLQVSPDEVKSKMEYFPDGRPELPIGDIDLSVFSDLPGVDSVVPENSHDVKDFVQIEDKTVLDIVGGEIHRVGSDGLVSIDDNVVKNGNSYVGVKRVELDDGTYVRDNSGRVISTKDKSGGLTRSFDFSGSSDPTKPTRVTIGNTTFERMSPITSNGKPVKQDGYDMDSWKKTDARGALIGNWYGDMRISKNGVFSVYENNSKELSHKGASDNVLSDDEAKQRNTDGIWPSQMSVVRPNDTRISASLKGNVVETLKEAYKENGLEIVRNWTHKEGVWASGKDTGKTRTNLSLDKNGTLRYKNDRGEFVAEHSDGSKSLSKNDVTNWFDKYGRQTSSVSKDGIREFKYNVDHKNRSTLSEVSTTIDGKETSWTKKAGSQSWINSKTKEVGKNLQVNDNGDIVFENSSGNKTRLDSSLTRTTYDSKNRPTEVEYRSGAKRLLEYDASGLSSFKDIIPEGGKLHTLEWKRLANSQTFESLREGGKKYERYNVSATSSGDIEYTGKDGKQHCSETTDIDRIARGEFVLSSESLVEARDRLTESAHEAGLDTGRFNKWVKEFEARAMKNKVDPEKVVKSMNNISDLLKEPSDGGQYSTKQRTDIAEILMHNLARPLEIDQGSHPTCNVTSVEVYAAVKHPDSYTGLVRDIALTGKWKTQKGKIATPPMKALKPGIDEQQYDVGKPDSAKRSLSSQVFQMTLINAMYETGEMNKKGKDNTNVRYILEEKLPITKWQNGYKITITPGEDELVRDGRKIGGNRDNDGPQMVQDDVLRSCEILFGDRPAFIENTSYYDAPGRGRVYDHDLITKDRLFEHKRKNQFPLLTPTMGGMHAQTIHDVWENPKNGKVWVLLDNQHGEPEVKGKKRQSGEGDGDGWIELDTLHRTLRMSSEGRGYGQPVMPKIRKYDHPSAHR